MQNKSQNNRKIHSHSNDQFGIMMDWVDCLPSRVQDNKDDLANSSTQSLYIKQLNANQFIRLVLPIDGINFVRI